VQVSVGVDQNDVLITGPAQLADHRFIAAHLSVAGECLDAPEPIVLLAGDVDHQVLLE
jgi:hypothetical protein